MSHKPKYLVITRQYAGSGFWTYVVDYANNKAAYIGWFSSFQPYAETTPGALDITINSDTSFSIRNGIGDTNRYTIMSFY